MAKAAQQASRNRQIVAARGANETLDGIAETFGLSKSRVKEILRDALEVPEPGVLTSAQMRLAAARRNEYVAAVHDVRALIAALSDDQASAKVGAFRVLFDGLDRLVRLEQALGYLPNDLRELAHDRTALDAVGVMLRTEKVPDAAVRALGQRLDEELWAA